jgi:hypothetical protein
MEFKRSKEILNGDLDCSRTWYVGFEYNRDYKKKPFSSGENERLLDDLIKIFEKYDMDWKLK